MPPRRRTDSSARRTELLEIAARLFATRGYTKTTVRDIADDAGILSGSLYHHFDSKEAMLHELLQDFMGSLHERFSEIAAGGGSSQDKLSALVRHSFQVIHDHPHQVALYQNESSLFSAHPDFEFVPQTGRRIEEVWQSVIREGQGSGEFRSDIDVSLAYRFIREAVWSSVQWYRPGGRFRHGAVADQYLAMLYGGLLT